MIPFIDKIRKQILIRDRQRRLLRRLREADSTWMLPEDEDFEGYMEDFIQNWKQSQDREYNQELLLTQARMSALQNQINPHFLYNTLDVIRSYALMKNCREVAEMTEALSTMFRYNIGRPEDMATLEEELENVRNYYLIQQYRFGDKFALDIQWDEEQELLEQYILPRLSLQPLVENAIHHGLESKMGKGLVCLRIFRTDTTLFIRVSDNGVGMDRESLLELREKLAQGTRYVIIPRSHGKSGIAMVNLNQRLKLLFGNEYGLDVSSLENSGTFFTISLPLLTKREWKERNGGSV